MAKISIKDVFLRFRLINNDMSLRASLGRMLTRPMKRTSHPPQKYFDVLQDINLQLNDGDRLGLTGNNGAGKSTLLRLIAGIYQPTNGSIHIEGSIAPLLNLHVGISPELTGRENIIRVSLLMGVPYKQTMANMDEIIEFTELQGFINQPVKTYSTGMLMRLIFATATSGHSDILLIDEIINVGDAHFQKKAIARIENLIKRTSIVVIASHSDELLKKFCKQRITLKNAEIIDQSPI